MASHSRVSRTRTTVPAPPLAGFRILVAAGLALLLGAAAAQDLRGDSAMGSACAGPGEATLVFDMRGHLSARGADLSCTLLEGLDLSDAALRGADLSGAVLTGAVLAFADLSCAVALQANLSGADLRGANLDHAVLSGAILSGAILRNASLRGAVLTGTDLTGADLAGVDLVEAWYDESTLWPAGFDPVVAGALGIEQLP